MLHTVSCIIQFKIITEWDLINASDMLQCLTNYDLFHLKLLLICFCWWSVSAELITGLSSMWSSSFAHLITINYIYLKCLSVCVTVMIIDFFSAVDLINELKKMKLIEGMQFEILFWPLFFVTNMSLHFISQLNYLLIYHFQFFSSRF